LGKRKHNGVQASAAADSDRNARPIPYDEAVTEGKDIIKKMDGEQRRHQMRLGELAERVERINGDRTVAKFAKAIGIASCTLHRYLAVYRKWDGDGKVAPGPVSYAVLRELADLDDRLELVTDKPAMTKREAQELRRAREGKPKKRKAVGDWKAAENKHWLRVICRFASEHGHTAEEVMQDEKLLCALREVAEPDVVAALAADLKVLLELSEALLEPQDEDVDGETAERKKPDLKKVEGVAA
jgi:hypothetical protein